MCLIRTGGEWPRGETCPPRLQKLSCVWRPGIYTHTCLCIHACLCRGGGGSLCFDKSLWCVGWSVAVFISLVWGRGVSSLSLATQSRQVSCAISFLYIVCVYCVYNIYTHTRMKMNFMKEKKNSWIKSYYLNYPCHVISLFIFFYIYLDIYWLGQIGMRLYRDALCYIYITLSYIF